VLLERAHLPLIRLQRSVALLRELLRAFRILLEQIVRLREPDQSLHQRAIVRYERLHALRERLHAKHARTRPTAAVGATRRCRRRCRRRRGR
jgi:hypothetical protein